MKVFLLLLSFLLVSCDKEASSTPFSLGIDPSFQALQVREKGDYLEGYIAEFLQAFAKRTGKTIQKVEGDFKALLSGLQKEKFQAIISDLPPYNFNLAKYDFSESLLEVGKVLVVAKESQAKSLQDMENPVLGIHEAELSGTLSAILPKDTVIKKYASYSKLLEALLQKDIKGAVLGRLLALSFEENNYFDKIKILKDPLTQDSLRIITLKGKEANFLRQVNEFLAKKKQQKKLKQKWSLL